MTDHLAFARFALLGLLATGCVGARPILAGSDRKGIEAAVSRYVAASNRGDADALTQLYAEDAVLLPPSHEPIEGRDAIGAFWHQGTDQGLQVTTLKVEVNGNLGYLVGRYHLPATVEEPADSGKYVMCLKRQLDGSWKLTADIWNSSGDSADDADEQPRPGASIS
ncbi:MAG TPA: SgcJ/EcaC family oxidoreductase [Gemmatimonadales bacterium]|nr:SgcJ/EcaC family oxidoreductase [Gemmatimonadales bacterium]